MNTNENLGPTQPGESVIVQTQYALQDVPRRERIATAAMQGLIEDAGAQRREHGVYPNPYAVATEALEYADALIAELEKTDDE